MNYLPKGIDAMGGLQPWMDDPRQLERHNGFGYAALEERINLNHSKSSIARDFNVTSTKPVKVWIERYKSEQQALAESKD